MGGPRHAGHDMRTPCSIQTPNGLVSRYFGKINWDLGESISDLIYVRAFQKLGDNERFVNDATFRNVFGRVQGPEPKPEMRVHVRLYYSAIGQPFDNCQTPYELLKRIFHSMVSA